MNNNDIKNMMNRQKKYKDSINKKQVLAPAVYFDKTLKPLAYDDLKKMGIGYGYKSPF